ncbi:hypothetical protein HAX54_009133, partial [Datura stramonium]|nr:hypothetical protein [Datura stramonium]
MIRPALQAGVSSATNAFDGSVAENITQAEQWRNHSQNNADIPLSMGLNLADYSGKWIIFSPLSIDLYLFLVSLLILNMYLSPNGFVVREEVIFLKNEKSFSGV